MQRLEADVMGADKNPNQAQREILRKYRAPYNPRENKFIELDNLQREFYFEMEHKEQEEE